MTSETVAGCRNKHNTARALKDGNKKSIMCAETVVDGAQVEMPRVKRVGTLHQAILLLWLRVQGKQEE